MSTLLLGNLVNTISSKFTPVANSGSGEVRRNITDGSTIGIASVKGDMICKKMLGGEWTFDSPSTGCSSKRLIKPICVNCRHNNYSGDVKSCCLTGASGNPLKTCNPVYTDNRFTGEACAPAWMEKCTSANIFSDPDCSTWRKSNEGKISGPINALIVDYCKTNPNDSNCQAQRLSMPDAYNQFMNIYCVKDKFDESICQGWAVTQSGLIDDRIFEYCNGKPAKGLCTCINSEVNKLVKTFGSRAQVQCIDEDCIRSGYRTNGMMVPCPSVVDCSVINAVRETGGSVRITDNVASQNCSATTTFSGEQKTSAITAVSNTSEKTINGVKQPSISSTSLTSSTSSTPLDQVPPPQKQVATAFQDDKTVVAPPVSDEDLANLSADKSNPTSFMMSASTNPFVIVLIVILCIAILGGILAFALSGNKNKPPAPTQQKPSW